MGRLVGVGLVEFTEYRQSTSSEYDRRIDFTPDGILSKNKSSVVKKYERSSFTSFSKTFYSDKPSSQDGILAYYNLSRKDREEMLKIQALEDSYYEECDRCGKPLFKHGCLNQIGSNHYVSTICPECDDYLDRNHLLPSQDTKVLDVISQAVQQNQMEG